MGNVFVPKQLEEVANQVSNGIPVKHTVRELLSWFFQYQRRTTWIVSVIRQALDQKRLRTQPDFDSTYLDARVRFLPRHESTVIKPAPVPMQISSPAPKVVASYSDPTHRVGRIESLVKNTPVTVRQDVTVEAAMTMMVENDYSQLPVSSDGRTILGVFSWKSLGIHRLLGHEVKFVNDAMDSTVLIDQDTPLFEVTSLVEENDCVFVTNSEGELPSVITPYDVGAVFKRLGEPFLVLEEIENHIRGLIEEKFSDDEIAAAFPNKKLPVKTRVAHSLTFGEYVHFLREPTRWSKLSLGVDRDQFIRKLDEIKGIRNSVMHFNVDESSGKNLKDLQNYVSYLTRINKLRPKSALAAAQGEGSNV